MALAILRVTMLVVMMVAIMATVSGVIMVILIVNMMGMLMFMLLVDGTGHDKGDNSYQTLFDRHTGAECLS